MNPHLANAGVLLFATCGMGVGLWLVRTGRYGWATVACLVMAAAVRSMWTGEIAG